MRRLLAVLGAIAMLGACGPKSPLKAEVLDYDHGSGKWRLATATLDTVEDLNVLAGSWFDVVGNQLISINDQELKAENPDALDTRRLASLVLERRGDPVQLSYDMVNDANGVPVALANDFESLAMLTVFHHFEKVWQFYRSDTCGQNNPDACVVKDASAATTTTSLVGFYSTVAADLGINIPVLTSDNAAFFSLSDSFIILRSQQLQGIPLFLNSGVIAHEFSHRVFHHNVYGRGAFGEYYRKNLIENIAEAADRQLRRTFVLLKGLDEGCADINGVGFMQRRDFIADSLEGEIGESTRLQRDLEGDWADAVTYGSLRSDNGPGSPAGKDLCATQQDNPETSDLNEQFSNDYENTGWNFYCVGTVWARTLWDGSGRDVAVLRDSILPALNRALARLGDDLANRWYFDFELILTHMIEEVTASGDTALCNQLRAAFTDKFADVIGLVPQC